MNEIIFFNFITLAALVVTASILCVGSVTLVNSLTTDLFSLVDLNGQSVPKFRTNDMERLKDTVRNYPRKLFTLYCVNLASIVLILVFYSFVVEIQQGGGKSFVVSKLGWKLETVIITTRIMNQWILPFCLLFFVSFSSYIVAQVTRIYSRYCAEK